MTTHRVGAVNKEKDTEKMCQVEILGSKGAAEAQAPGRFHGRCAQGAAGGELEGGPAAALEAQTGEKPE